MKARRQADWSFLLMRGAEHAVKQFTIKKRSLVATPVALLAIISGCFIGLKLQAASQIKDLELQLATLTSQYEQADSQYEASLALHESTIVNLEDQIKAAQQKQLEIDKKLVELVALEKQLEQFMSTYGAHTPLELDRDLQLTPLSQHTLLAPITQKSKTTRMTQLSNSFTDDEVDLQANTYHLASYAAIHELPIQEMSKVVDNFIEVMHYNLHKAGKIRTDVDAYPDFWPSSSVMTTSGFGYRIDPFTKQLRFHAGIDIDGSKGDVIFSAGDGTVVEAGNHSSYGKFIVIKHTDQLKTLYSHLSVIEAKTGDIVVKGEKIGKMGSSGRSTGTHLHFQVMLNDQPVSPLKYLINTNK